ncbi:hypothetical protein [Streptomyces benahoarensis]|uniref:hypothetical protein n=1 Tax=Streptomyces benahoarensis TaxID=2595054 RepID=UPI00163DA941|nr:hypothetical protein [Streptomyces benahoarensis]
MRGVVHELLGHPGLKGAPDVARLAAVTLAAKTRCSDLVVRLTSRELGRWLGVGPSTVGHVVRPKLGGEYVVRSRDALLPGTNVVVGIDWQVVALWEARHQHGLDHPLRLSKPEFAVFLRLLEAVCGPGWVHADGTKTEPGLLGTRTGPGAATDRLALLLLVLEARETGVVRLRGGAVDRHGRAAATLAWLLDCETAEAATVLRRLERAGVVSVRQDGGREQVLVPAVRAAYREMRRVRRAEGRPGALVPRPRLAGDSAGGDQDSSGSVFPQVNRRKSGSRAGYGVAGHHAYHSPGATGVDQSADGGGFSGYGRADTGVMPEGTRTPEDQPTAEQPAAAAAPPPECGGGPLRGEQPKTPPTPDASDLPAAGRGAAHEPKHASERARRQPRAGLPADLRLRVALGPVAGLWRQLGGWQQDQVAAATKTELARLSSMLEQPGDAPQVLADRLTDRLAETGGETWVSTPFGWLTHRGLKQRPACSDRRCDDGIRLDTGGDCGTCGNMIHLRRAHRARIGTDLDREQPGLTDTERRQLVEARLREHTAAQAQDLARRRERAAAEQARRTAARAAAEARAERKREAEAAAAAARKALPCADCGQQRSAGLCEACGYRRRTEALIEEAGQIAATWTADLTDPADIAAVFDYVRTVLGHDIALAHEKFLTMMEQEAPGEFHGDLDPAAVTSALAFRALQTVEEVLPEYRSSALRRLARTPQAETEARRAYTAEQNRRWYRANPHGADAVAAATKAADTARTRTAQHLLDTRLAQLRQQTTTPTEQPAAAVAPWSDRLVEMAARPLDDETQLAAASA